MAAQKSCWFKSLALSSLEVVLVEGQLATTDTQTVIQNMIEAHRDYCLAYSSDQEEDSDEGMRSSTEECDDAACIQALRTEMSKKKGIGTRRRS